MKNLSLAAHLNKLHQKRVDFLLLNLSEYQKLYFPGKSLNTFLELFRGKEKCIDFTFC